MKILSSKLDDYSSSWNLSDFVGFRMYFLWFYGLCWAQFQRYASPKHRVEACGGTCFSSNTCGGMIDVSEHSPSYWPKNHTRILYDGCLFPSFSYRIKMKRSQRLPLQVSSKNIKSKCLEIGKSTGCCLDLFLKIMPDVHWTNQKYRVAKKNPTIWWRSFFFFSFLDTLPISPQFHHDLTRGPITIHQP